MSATNVSSPPQTPEHEQLAAVKQSCLDITESYRAGSVSKTIAILRLQEALPGSDGTDDERQTYVSALESYVIILDGFDRLRRGAAAYGGLGQGGNNAGDREGVAQSEQGDRSDDDIPSIAASPHKRARSPDSDDDAARAPTRRKVDLESLPWAIREKLAPSSLSFSVRQAQSILKNISGDPKLVKADLYTRLGLPQFPDSEWTHLLIGQAVNLDHVLSGMYSISHDERRTEKLADGLDFIFGGVKSSKTVQSHGQWVTAWSATVDATKIVFPHRERELREYGNHISSLFTSFAENMHDRVIKYDRALRIRVGQRWDLLLTDSHQFADLHVLWISGAGAAAAGPSSSSARSFGGGGTAKPRKRDPCNRFNSGNCPNTTAGCDYAHICSNCRGGGHTATACTQPQRRK